MPIKKYTVLLFIFLFASSCLITLKAKQDSLLNVLHKTLLEKDKYIAEKEQRISDLKKMLNVSGITPLQTYDVNLSLYYEYRNFKIDSAIVYAKKNIQIAEDIGYFRELNESKINLSTIYSISMMYVEAMDLLRSVPEYQSSLGEQIKYFDAYKHFYNYYSHDSEYFIKYFSFYRDTLITLYEPESTGYKMLNAEKLVEDGKIEEARRILLTMFESAQSEDGWRAILAHKIGETYVYDKDIEMQIEYFAISSIADIRNANKENASMHALAISLFENNDVDLAYLYIQQALEDANFSNARLRAMEVSRVFPIIEKAYQDKITMQKDRLSVWLTGILIISVFLIGMVIYIFVQMKKLARARQSLRNANKKLNELNVNLQETNDQTHKINKELSESNLLKEEYIARYMNQSSAYLDKLEEYRRMLSKIAASGKVEDLFRVIKSKQFMENELKEFYSNFDNSFLQLFPDFVDKFNDLLVEGERIIPKQKELLNTELRIFALIRLGINDSLKIAQFLRYPVNTIYNYRTNVRSKAVGQRDELEKKVMEIGLINI